VALSGGQFNHATKYLLACFFERAGNIEPAKALLPELALGFPSGKS